MISLYEELSMSRIAEKSFDESYGYGTEYVPFYTYTCYG